MHFQTMLLNSFAFTLLMCESRVQPITTTLVTAVITFGIHPFVYEVERDALNLF